MTGLPSTVRWTAESDHGYASFGWSVGTAGDVNGDGRLDVIVGAHNYDSGQTNKGRAFLYYGNGGSAPIAYLGMSDSGMVAYLFGWDIVACLRGRNVLYSKQETCSPGL